MRQIRLDRFGGPQVLRPVAVPEPEPGPGEVVVRMAAAGVTFVETQVRAGRPPWPGPLPALPLVPGNAVAGPVVAVGEGVDPALVGREVVTATGGSGGYAEAVAVPAGDLVPLPPGIDAGRAVALVADGRTALALAQAARIGAGERVLVLAAAGGVGGLLVQLAREAGAHVVAAAGGERKVAACRAQGADEAVDYTQPGWWERVGAIDVVLDGVGGELGERAGALLRPGGRLLVHGAASGAAADTAAAAARGVTVVAWRGLVRSPEHNRALVDEALAGAATGRLQPVVGRTFPLSRARDAHAAIERRETVGKTVLVPDAAALGPAEVDYLRTQRLGRLATVQADGTPQVSPVGFRLNPRLGTIDIGGRAMAATRKFRNVAGNGVAAFVVDDIASVSPWRVRGVEIRGSAEALGDPLDPAIAVGDGAIIRILPERVVAWGVE